MYIYLSLSNWMCIEPAVPLPLDSSCRLFQFCMTTAILPTHLTLQIPYRLTRSQFSPTSFLHSRLSESPASSSHLGPSSVNQAALSPLSDHSLPDFASVSTRFDMDRAFVKSFRHKYSCCKPVIRGGYLWLETRCLVPARSKMHFSDARSPGTLCFLLQTTTMTDLCLSLEDPAIKSQGN